MNEMDCMKIEQIEDYLDDMLDDAARDRFREHIEACPGCRGRLARERTLRDALRTLPEPALDPEFAARAFSQAAAAQKNRRRVDTSILLRIAASILVIVAIGFVFRGTWGPGQPEWPEAYVRLNEPEEVKLVFHSREEMKNVTFSLSAPDGIELVGFGDRREIVWEVDLERGENLLVLPVIARNREGGPLIAEIRHGGRNKQFGLRLKVQQPEGSGTDRFEGNLVPTRFI